MTSIKICMLAPEFLPVWGGVGSYIIELVKHLPKNIEVHIVTPLRKAVGRDKVASEGRGYSEHFGENVHIHFVSRATDSFFYNVEFQFAVAKHVPNLIMSEKIDLIHSHTAHMPDVLLQFRGIDIPVVTTIHTTIKGQREGTKKSYASFQELEFSEKATMFLYPMLRLIEKIYFTRERHYITVSNWMKKQVVKLYPKLLGRIHVVHNAVDPNFWKPNKDHENKKEELGVENVILYNGRLLALKGVRDLVRAIPLIIRETRDVMFIFIGPGNRDVYRNMLKKIGVPERNFKFLGYKRREELLKYYNIATVFILPSYSENLPMTILEAMSCSLPVIATKVGGIPEVIEHNKDGILINPGNISELAHSLICLLQDKPMCKKLGLNARKKIEKKFSWSKIIPKIIKVYEKALMYS